MRKMISENDLKNLNQEVINKHYKNYVTKLPDRIKRIPTNKTYTGARTIFNVLFYESEKPERYAALQRLKNDLNSGTIKIDSFNNKNVIFHYIGKTDIDKMFKGEPLKKPIAHKCCLVALWHKSIKNEK